MVSKVAQYQSRFRNIVIDRQQGIITLRVHTDEGPLLWGNLEHSICAQLGEAFREVALDPQNKVVILTGTGDHFCTARDSVESAPTTVDHWSRQMREIQDMLMGFLDIPVPVIAAVNGPVSVHAELLVLADMIIAAGHTWFEDAHLRAGVVPGDGGQIIWREVLGLHRSRRLLLTDEKFSAADLHSAGVIMDVLPADQVYPRARELAQQLCARPLQTLRYTRSLMTQRMKRLLNESLGHGLALQGLALCALSERN